MGRTVRGTKDVVSSLSIKSSGVATLVCAYIDDESVLNTALKQYFSSRVYIMLK